jgi:hypothetical protein
MNSTSDRSMNGTSSASPSSRAAKPVQSTNRSAAIGPLRCPITARTSPSSARSTPTISSSMWRTPSFCVAWLASSSPSFTASR